ncbi:MAG: ATP-binding cassette domain-containing protein [Lachnospiraceae bacterium]|nr:ATP-binding cassette domain-containing protein [Lachnospiraceae bacterium]
MIKIENLKLVINKKIILEDINMELKKGNIYGIVGNNGCGKTMLMKCICGFVKPTEGKVISEGKEIRKDCDYLENAGVIIENPGFIPYYSGYKNLKILADIKGMIGKEEIKKTMEICGLDAELRLSVKKYSLGMKQRLGLAQAIMENPKILIFDEPMNGLDKEGVNKIRELFLQMKKEKIILLASHNPADIDILCDEVFEMDRGRIIKKTKKHVS